MYYYFAFSNGDPMKSSFNENELSIENMKKQFVGTFIRTGDEEHDFDRVADIWTEAEATAYYNR